MQDRHSEADAELLKICHVVQTFPPDESSVCILNHLCKGLFLKCSYVIFVDSPA